MKFLATHDLCRNKLQDQPIQPVTASDGVTGINDSTRVALFSASSQVTLRNDVVVTRLELRFLPNDST